MARMGHQGVTLVDREGTCAAILDSASAAEFITYSPNAAANFRNSLNALADACRAQGACAKEIKAPTFLTCWRATPKAFHFLISVQEGARPILSIAVIVGLAFALFAYPFAAIGRRLDLKSGLERKSWRMLRLVSWTGALLALGALALAGMLIMNWSTSHMLAVPLGLPESIAFTGFLSLAGMLVAGYAAVRAWAARKGGAMPVGTLVGTTIVALCALGALVLLVSIGGGPILV